MPTEEPNVLFLLPQYGGQVSTQCFESLLNWALHAGDYGIQWNWITDSGSTLLPRARSQLVALALELEDWTHIIMVDADMGFTISDVCHLVLSNKDIIAGVAPLKTYPLQTNSSTGDGILKTENDCQQCKYVGTGFICIERNAIEKMCEAYKDSLTFESIDGHSQERYKVVDLFATITNGGDEEDPALYLTEDYAFCKRARDIGLEVWQDTVVNPSHTGMHTFSFDEEANMLMRYNKSNGHFVP